MARIRSIKPEFPQSESMGRVSREARLLFVLLWPVCDDHGRTRASSRMLASTLFPYDDGEEGRVRTSGADVGRWLDELERESCIRRYEADGSTYLEICNWLKHQKIDKPSKPQFPEPSPSPREDSRESIEGSPLEGKGREGSGEEAREGKPRDASPSGSRLPADWQLPDDWRDWAKAERPDIDAKTEAASFADYWHAKPGKDGRKTDWQATWRNWIRRARGSPPNGRAVTAAHSPAASRPL
jgi:hypothetical protein